MTDFETLTFAQSGPVTSIVLNRPDAANGMNDTLTRELAGRGSAVRHRGDEGGHDHRRGPILLRRRRPQGHGRGTRRRARSSRASPTICTARCRRSPAWTPCVITAVNGTAAGAGFSLAVTGDLVLSAESAKFTMAYTQAGLSPDGSSSYYLPRLIGIRRTQELMLTNRTLTAAEALDWGLVTEVVPDADLAARTDSARQGDGRAPRGRRTPRSRRLLLGTYRAGIEEQMELEGRYIAECADPPTARRASRRSWASGARELRPRRSAPRRGTRRWPPRWRTPLPPCAIRHRRHRSA